MPRYLFVALTGAVLAATFAAWLSLASRRWKPISILLGAGVLLLKGQ